MKTAIVTGGTGGIGKIIAKALHDTDFQVVLVARHGEALEQAAKEIGENTKFFACNVTDYLSIEKFFKELPQIDVLVNCAGILGPTEPLSNSSVSDWEQVVNVNLFGTVNCCKAATSKLEQSNPGKIINVSGGGAAFARPLHSAYATSKAGVVRFTEELSQELKNTDINVIAPGAHKTKLWDKEKVDEHPSEWANPEDVVKLILFLVSEKSN